MSQNINTVDISNDANLEDYVLVSVNGSLRRVKVANLKELVDSTEDIVVVDTELSTTSVNPVQNRVITEELNKKANSSDMPTYQKKIDNTLTTTSKEVVGAINENTSSINQLSGGKADKSEVNELKEDLSNEVTNRNTAVSTERTRAISVENTKISKPTTTDNNKFPRAKNGDVEWVEQGLPTDEQTSSAVTNWLNAHPEATTTVQDKSLEVSKLTDNAKLFLYKDYVTPEMFGAIGDGEHDDTNCIINAINTEKPVIFDIKKTYLISSGLITAKNNIFLNNATILVKPTGDIEYIFKIQKGYELSGGTIKVVETSHKVGGLLCGACKIRNINLVNLTYHGVKNTGNCYYNVFENIKIWHSTGSTNYIDGHNIDFGSSPVPNCCTFIGCMLNGKCTGSKIKLAGSNNRFIGCDSSFGSNSAYNDVILELIGNGNDLALYIEGTSNDYPFIIISGNTNKLNISGMLTNRAKEKVLTDTGILNEVNFIHNGNNFINIKSFPHTIDFEGKYGVIESPYNSVKSYAVINDYRITNKSNIGNISQTTVADNNGFTITGEDENTTCSTCTFFINNDEMRKGYIDFDVIAYSTFKTNGSQYTSNGEKVHIKLVGVSNFSVYNAYKSVRVENISITYLA